MSMSGYWNIVKSIISNSDLVIEVIDARMPEITRNKYAEDLVEGMGRKLVIVANKSDFLSKETAEKYMEKFKDIPFFLVSIRKREGVTILKRSLFKIIEKKNDPSVNIGVIGYPNTGKSSLINALCGRKAIIAGSRPGTTRCGQMVRMNRNVMLMDTPGVIPTLDWDETKQLMMNTLDPGDAKRMDLAATEIVKIFLQENKKLFEEMYDVKTEGKSFEEIFQEIGMSKSLLVKGGKADLRRVYMKIIYDWQKGSMLKD